MPQWLLTLLGGPLIDKVLSFIPNPAEKASVALEIQKAIIEEGLKASSDQRDINKAEAANPSAFVAGWRPAVGWLCVATLAYQWMVVPLGTYVILLVNPGLQPLPVLGSSDTQTLLYALLGLGGYRTVEKFGGVATTGISGIIAKVAGK